MKKLILILTSMCAALGVLIWETPTLRGFFLCSALFTIGCTEPPKKDKYLLLIPLLMPKEKTLEEQLGEAIGNVQDIPPFTFPEIPAQVPEKE